MEGHQLRIGAATKEHPSLGPETQSKQLQPSPSARGFSVNFVRRRLKRDKARMGLREGLGFLGKNSSTGLLGRRFAAAG
ncbi:hypothetical protein FOPE_06593 [Fonsecaea pedrosoi]|nr:hypothetical protein FOPE_06593 [Fonsecaea pedrosoi]